VKIDDEGTFIITSWTHNCKLLCSNGDGRVLTTENKEGSWEKWKVSLHSKSHGVKIQSVEHGRYLAYSGKDLYTMVKDEDTAWHLEPANRNQFFISLTSRGKRISSSHDSPFTFTSLTERDGRSGSSIQLAVQLGSLLFVRWSMGSVLACQIMASSLLVNPNSIGPFSPLSVVASLYSHLRLAGGCRAM